MSHIEGGDDDGRSDHHVAQRRRRDPSPHILPILVVFDTDQLRKHGMEMMDEWESLWMMDEVEEVPQRNYVSVMMVRFS